MLENRGFMSCQETSTRTVVGSVWLQVKHIIVVFPSYLALLTLEYGGRKEKSLGCPLPLCGGGGAFLQRSRESY